MDRPGREALSVVAHAIAAHEPRWDIMAAEALDALDKAGFEVVRKLPPVEAPTEPGWYWARLPQAFAGLELVQVYRNNETRPLVVHSQGYTRLSDWTDWRGPLVPPEDE